MKGSSYQYLGLSHEIKTLFTSISLENPALESRAEGKKPHWVKIKGLKARPLLNISTILHHFLEQKATKGKFKA